VLWALGHTQSQVFSLIYYLCHQAADYCCHSSMAHCFPCAPLKPFNPGLLTDLAVVNPVACCMAPIYHEATAAK